MKDWKKDERIPEPGIIWTHDLCIIVVYFIAEQEPLLYWCSQLKNMFMLAMMICGTDIIVIHPTTSN